MLPDRGNKTAQGKQQGFWIAVHSGHFVYNSILKDGTLTNQATYIPYQCTIKY